VLAGFGDSSPTRALWIFCGLTEDALRRPWQAISALGLSAFLRGNGCYWGVYLAAKGGRKRDGGLEILKMDPLMGPLRNEPRFQAIERSLKFPD
jgi:hypothetical protein